MELAQDVLIKGEDEQAVGKCPGIGHHNDNLQPILPHSQFGFNFTSLLGLSSMAALFHGSWVMGDACFFGIWELNKCRNYTLGAGRPACCMQFGSFGCIGHRVGNGTAGCGAPSTSQDGPYGL